MSGVLRPQDDISVGAYLQEITQHCKKHSPTTVASSTEPKLLTVGKCTNCIYCYANEALISPTHSNFRFATYTKMSGV